MDPPSNSLVAIFDSNPEKLGRSTGHLYHVPKTISSPIVQCLYELDQIYKDRTIVDNLIQIHHMTFATIKQPEYLAINPMGTSPGYQEGASLIMWESGAVLDYLLETFDTNYQLHPPPVRSLERAKYLQLKQYIIATVYPFVASLFIHVMTKGENQDIEYVRTAKTKFLTLMAPVLDQALVGPFFFGSTPTAIDFLVTKPLNNALGLDLLDDFPRLKTHVETMKRRDSFVLSYNPILKSPSAETSYEKTRSFVFVPATEQN